MSKNIPENTTPETESPAIAGAADQTAEVQHTEEPATLSISSIAGAHVEAHPGFDPGIHAANPDGSPKRRADGSYALKRGRKAGGAASPLPPKSGNAPAAETAQPAPAPETPRITPDEAARQSANLVVHGCVLLCGEQIGIPENKDEAQGLLFGFKNYYEARGVPNIPPEIGLIITVGMYVAPRIRKSETAKGKLTRLIEMIKSKIGG